MKLQHPRAKVVREAGIEIRSAVSFCIKKHDLTYGELFSILSDCMAQWAMYAIRDERLPDNPDTPGDAE